MLDNNKVFQLENEINKCNKRLSQIRKSSKRKRVTKKIDEMLEKDNFDTQIIYKLLNEQTLNFSPHFVLKDRQIISNEEDVKEEVRAHFQ